jgi:predicted aspartyl protease
MSQETDPRPETYLRRQTLGLFAGAGGALVGGRALAAAGPVSVLPEAVFEPELPSDHIEAMQDTLRRMTAPVLINGQGPFDFVVDTGTNRSVVSRELAETLGLPAGPITILQGIVGAERSPSARVDTFTIGQREARRLIMPSLPRRHIGGDGILGVDGLRNQRVVMDFIDNVLSIESSSVRARDEGMPSIPARRRFGQLTVVDTDLDGIRVSVVMDTGSENTIANSALRAALGRRRGVGELRHVTVVGATGETAIGEYGLVPSFRLGPLRINNLRVVYADLHPFRIWELTNRPAMLLGIDVMRFLERVTLDFGRSEVRMVLPPTPFVDPAGDPRRVL